MIISPHAYEQTKAFTKHIVDAMMKAFEEKLELEVSIPRKCHIPSSGLAYACFHLCIMFKFLKLELREIGSLKTLNKRRAKTLKISFIVPKCSS